ncbi:MAG TPA: hypothetical protein GXZ90_02055, partial [Clostridiales bacterium]|nr:hypothetical protein [Clostridiales bacterium]
MIIKKRIYIMFTIIAILLVSVVSARYSHSAANAFNFCSEMGSYMGRVNPKNSFFAGAIQPDEPNRKWTVEEVFSKSTVFTSYYGEGEGDWIYSDKVDRGENRVGSSWNDSGVQDNLKSARKGCILGRGDFVSWINLALSGGVVNLTNLVITGLLGKDFMAESIIEIIGGAGDPNDGLIGVLRNSLYMPLVIIAFFMTTITIIYKGLIQMKFREALSSAIWSLGAFIVGLTLMFTPKMLAELPQKVTSTITTCVLGALNGQNCLSGNVTTPSLLAGVECISQVAGHNGADMMVNGMNCTIWKTFVLEPWAEEQFGAPYSELYTYNVPEGGSLWANLPSGEGSQYCVNLASTNSINDSIYALNMDLNSDSTVCNVAIYQLYLKTIMSDPINHSGDEYNPTRPHSVGGAYYDERWYDIIVPMAQDNSNWKNWSGQNRFFGRTLSSFMSLIAVIAASILLIPLAVFGGAYKLVGLIMMAFAPLFLLFAIEPTRGRKIFLGWLETLISSFLKYFAITMLVVVSLVLYAGVLSNTSGSGAFLAVIILTTGLSMYRKEIIDLIGATNMGGQRLSNKVGKGLEKTKEQLKEKGAAYAGGAVGGAVGAMSKRREDIIDRKSNLKYLQSQLSNATSEEEKEKIQDEINKESQTLETDKSFKNMASTLNKGAKMGGKDSAKRAMKRGTSSAAAAFRQFDSTKKDLKKENELINKEETARDEKLKEEMGRQGQSTDKRLYNNDSPSADKYINKSNVDESNNAQHVQDTQEITIDSQREKVEYQNNLNENEIKALDDFADKLTKIDNDDDLLQVANDDELMKDVNKENLVTNEINARLKYNSLNKMPSGELSRHEFASLENVSQEELELNFKVHTENYLETRNPQEFDKLNKNILEYKNRGLITETANKAIVASVSNEAKKIDESKEKYVRDENVPTNKELKENLNKY